MNARGLYNSFGMPEARHSFEDTLLKNLKERLTYISLRAEKNAYNGAQLQEAVGEVVEDDYDNFTKSSKLEEAASSALEISDFEKDEWCDIICLMRALVGVDPYPDDDAPIDLNAILEVVARYRARWAENEDISEWSQDEIPSPLMKTGVPGRPTAIHFVITEFERRAAQNQCEKTLTREAQTLAAWYRRHHPEAPILSRKTIENRLRQPYRDWKARWLSDDPQNQSTKL